MQRVFQKSLLVLLVLPFILFAQSNEMSKEAAESYNQGNKLLKTGNYTKAIVKYDEALKSSDDYRIYYQKAMSYKKLRNYTKAANAFTECTKKNSGFAAAYNGLGSVYFTLGKYENAIENFKHFGELTSKKNRKLKAKEYIARAYTKLGVSYKADGKRDKAIQSLSKAVESYKFDAAYLSLAEIYVELAKYDKALEAADKALNYRKSISRGAAYFYKGLAFKGKKQNNRAIENFELGKKDPKYKSSCMHYIKELKN